MELVIGLIVIGVVGYFMFFRKEKDQSVYAPVKVETTAPVAEVKAEEPAPVAEPTPVVEAAPEKKARKPRAAKAEKPAAKKAAAKKTTAKKTVKKSKNA